MTPDEILKQVQNAAKVASEKLATKNTKVLKCDILIENILIILIFGELLNFFVKYHFNMEVFRKVCSVIRYFQL